MVICFLIQHSLTSKLSLAPWSDLTEFLEYIIKDHDRILQDF